MLFVDPSGRALRVLHLFRRSPLVSVTLAVRSVAAARALYEGALGMRPLGAEARAALRLPPQEAAAAAAGGAGAALALAFSEAPDATALVLVEAAAAPAGGEGEEERGEAPLVLEVEAPRARLGALRAAAAAAGLEASEFDAARDASFLCEDRDGHVLRVAAAAAEMGFPFT